MGKETIDVPKDVVIFKEGEEGRFMYLIHEGKVKITRRGEDIVTLEKGDFFGDIGLLTGEPRVADAIALEDCKLVLIDEKVFDEIIKSSPNLAIRIMRKQASRLRDLYGFIEKAGISIKKEKEMEEEPLPESIEAWLELEDTGEKFPIKTKITFLGRKDLASDFVPHVDLTDYDENRFVSRRHGRIILKEGNFFIREEIGVLNGTFLNNRRLTTGFLYELKDGDKITLGRISLFFKEKTKTSS